MSPFSDLAWFALALLLALPALLLGFSGRKMGWWALVASLIMLVVHSGGEQNRWASSSLSDLWVVVGYVALQWLLARLFLRLRPEAQHRLAFTAVILTAVAPLILVKASAVLSPDSRLGFLGISYVTFRALDVLIGIHDRLVSEVPLPRYLGYLLFFPTIASGPIDRYRRWSADWAAVRTRNELVADLDAAVHQIFTGLLYKFILAALVQAYWMDRVSAGRDLLSTVSYMYAYSAFLFFDFAGYSALAVGASRFFGIRTPPNFDRPFLAANIADFWNRWHISLSTWFRDQIYSRVVLAATKGKWFASRYTASYLGFGATFLLMGLWHGFRGFYLLYGLYHAILLSGHSALSRRIRKRWPALVATPGWRLLGQFTTFQLVCFGFLLFSGHLSEAPAQRLACAGADRSRDSGNCGVDSLPHRAMLPAPELTAKRQPPKGLTPVAP